MPNGSLDRTGRLRCSRKCHLRGQPRGIVGFWGWVVLRRELDNRAKVCRIRIKSVREGGRLCIGCTVLLQMLV